MIIAREALRSRAEESLVALIKVEKEGVRKLIQEKLKPGETVEYILAKGLIPIGPKEFQGAEAKINRMSFVERFRISDRIIARRKINFAAMVGNQHVSFRVRALILKPAPIFGKTKNKGGFLHLHFYHFRCMIDNKETKIWTE